MKGEQELLKQSWLPCTHAQCLSVTLTFQRMKTQSRNENLKKKKKTINFGDFIISTRANYGPKEIE